MVPPPRERLRAQTVFRTPSIRLGSFEARPDEALFAAVSPPGHHLVAFPHTELRIEYERAGSFVVDPTRVTFYNPDEIYERRAIDPAGDRCTWLSASQALMDELVGEHLSTPIDASHIFPKPIGVSSAALFAEQRTLMSLAERKSVSALQVEEAAISLLARLFEGAWPDSQPAAPRASGAMTSSVSRAQELLAAEFRGTHTIQEIARQAGCSPFHLCRAFKFETGQSLHRYRTALRLRHGFDELLMGGRAITDIALDLGFSSHSHFSTRFKGEFGRSPRSVRGPAVPPNRNAARVSADP